MWIKNKGCRVHSTAGNVIISYQKCRRRVGSKSLASPAKILNSFEPPGDNTECGNTISFLK